MEGITTLLFDIDGTVLDTREFIYQATEYALKTGGHMVPKRSVIAQAVGEPFPKYYITITGEDRDAEALCNMHHEFQHKNFHLVQPFPRAFDTLRMLHGKGYKIAAVTSRSDLNSHIILKNAGLYDFFDTIVSLEDVPKHKPDPAALFLALERLKEKPEHAVMVGDTHIDIEAGKNAGTKTIRATYGFHNNSAHDPEPDYFIDDISDLLKIL